MFKRKGPEALKDELEQREKDRIPLEANKTNQPLSYTQFDEKQFHYLVSDQEENEETKEEVAHTLGIVHVSRPSIKHVFFLFKPLLNPILRAFEKQQHELDHLLTLLTLERVFLDRQYAISQNVPYTVDFKGHKFLYLQCQQALSIVVGQNILVVTPGQWLQLSYPMGTQVYASGISDLSPVGITVRACDVPMTMAVSENGTWNINLLANSVATVLGTVGMYRDYPTGAVIQEVSSGNVAATAASATLIGAAGTFTYLSGFSVTGAGATAASVILVTITGLTNTLTFALVIPAGATTSITPLIVEFVKPIQSSALNTAIVVNVPSFGAGNTNAVVNAHGYNV